MASLLFPSSRLFPDAPISDVVIVAREAYECWVEKGEPEGKTGCVKLLGPGWSVAIYLSKLASSPLPPPPPPQYHGFSPYDIFIPGSLLLFPCFDMHFVPLPLAQFLLFFFHSGGAQYDQNHIILNTVNTEKLTQVWEAMVL